MNKLILSIPVIFFFLSAVAQEKDRVNQLVAAENYFGAQVKSKGMSKGFLAVTDENTIIFRPGPVEAEKYLKEERDTSRGLSWHPVYAKISKSGDWGFTTGPYVYKGPNGTGYGDYFSVWQKNSRNVWKLAIDIGVPHKKPASEPPLQFLNAATDKYQHQPSEARLQQRADLILSSDKLYATTLRANNQIAFEEFLNDDCRLLFPGNEPILGNTAVTAFWAAGKYKLRSEPQVANRAVSGDLAYTYGTATIEQAGVTKNYNYVRVWSVQAGYVWKVIAEIYTPAIQ